PEQAKPDDKAQRNFTDPESRILPDGANKGSFVQGYNAQNARQARRPLRVEAGVRGEQSPEALQVRMGGADGVKRDGKL
ncbi:MAG: hypothetical protein ACLGSH_17895, partial [Acidobacteriota bacterium]